MFQENECKKTKTREHNMCYFQQIVVFITFLIAETKYLTETI